MSACVCGGVCALRWAEHKEIYLWDLFYWLVFKVARLWAAFPLFENMLLLAVSQRCIHLCRRLNYNPLIHLKSERSSGMLRRDNCQASLQTPSAPSTPQGEREGEGERKGGWTSVCSQTEPGVAEEEEGIICGTTLRAEPSATALLLPDHNQMCQVCPNRNDCVKAIFSNLSDFRVAPFPTRLPPPHSFHLPHASWKTNTNAGGAQQSFSNGLPWMLTLLVASSAVMWWKIYSATAEHKRGKTRPVVLTNNRPPRFHASALPSLPIQMCNLFALCL